MAGGEQMNRFVCRDCGSPSIVIPPRLVDEAPVSCGGCYRVISSWSEYKSRISSLIVSEFDTIPGSSRTCIDPLSVRLLPREISICQPA